LPRRVPYSYASGAVAVKNFGDTRKGDRKSDPFWAIFNAYHRECDQW
jgi:hypothetical protein